MHMLRLRYRMLGAFLLVIVISITFPLLYARHIIFENSLTEVTDMAFREAQTISAYLVDNKETTVENLNKTLHRLSSILKSRITVISNDGTVLADSALSTEEVQLIDNHGDRIEIVEARTKKLGNSVRASTTLGGTSEYIYAAVQYSGNGSLPAGFVRVSMSISNVLERNAYWGPWVGVALFAALLAMLLAYGLSSRMEASLKSIIRVVEGVAAGGEVRKRLHVVPSREFRALARAVNDMADRIEDNIATIEDQTAQFSAILDTMTEGVLVLNSEGRIRLANTALYKLFPNIAEGKLPVEAIPVAELQEAFDNLYASDTEHAHFQIEPQKGMILNVSLACPRSDQKPLMAVAVFHDVSELVHLMRMRRDFVANVSHELRTPLTAIQGYAETLLGLDPEDRSTHQRFLETICRHTGYMSRIVEDLLALSRIESGAVPMNMTNVNVADFIESCSVQSRPLCTDKQQHLVLQADPKLQVAMDPHFMGQVLRNLFENACRHAPENSTIAAKAWQEKNNIVFEVQDEGPGIPKSEQIRVFERFYRVDKHRGPSRNGTATTGLGLAICKHIVERHKGRIWVEESPKGACFRFMIPYKSVSSSEPLTTNKDKTHE